MAGCVLLKDILVELECASDDAASYLDKQTGQVVLVTSEHCQPESQNASMHQWQRDFIERARQIVEDTSGRFLRLPVVENSQNPREIAVRWCRENGIDYKE